MKIALASDHAGFAIKEALKPFLEKLGHSVEDFGAHKVDPADDYPDFIVPAAKAVAEGKADRGIVLARSGEGEAIAANRIRGVRAAMFYGGNREIIKLSREHNDSNVLSLSAWLMSEKEVQEVVQQWLETDFSGSQRHVRRLKKLEDMTA